MSKNNPLTSHVAENPSEHYLLPDSADGEAIRAEASSLGIWQQRVRLSSSVFTPGIWASWDIAKVLFHEFPESWWDGKRVLDIGANCGGLTLELLRRGASVTAAEPYAPYRDRIRWWQALLAIPDDRLKIVDYDLFHSHKLGSFDIVLCLGLVYHFRHPQLVLDYIGNLDSQHFAFSTQTYKSKQDVMINRSEITPQYLNGKPLAGWHPSRGLFLKMLACAGFEKARAIQHPSVSHDWGDRAQTTTNSGYFAADRGVPVDVELEAHRFI